MRQRPGRPYPLGATWDGEGVNFAIFSENATGVDLCLFDVEDQEREHLRLPLVECTDQVRDNCMVIEFMGRMILLPAIDLIPRSY